MLSLAPHSTRQPHPLGVLFNPLFILWTDIWLPIRAGTPCRPPVPGLALWGQPSSWEIWYLYTWETERGLGARRKACSNFKRMYSCPKSKFHWGLLDIEIELGRVFLLPPALRGFLSPTGWPKATGSAPLPDGHEQGTECKSSSRPYPVTLPTTISPQGEDLTPSVRCQLAWLFNNGTS